MVDDTQPKKPRGFAAMSPERRREVARKGGESVGPQERAFFKNRDLAARAGRVGGEAKAKPKGSRDE